MPDETKTPQDAKPEAAVGSEAQKDAGKPAEAGAAAQSAKPDAPKTQAQQDAPEAEAAPEGVAMKLDQFETAAATPPVAQPAAEAPEADPPTEACESIPMLQAQIEQLKADLSAKEDQLLRAVADVQNVRRRAERDRKDAEVYGGRKLARDLLAVYDNIESALQYASDSLKENEPDFFKGVELTRNGLIDAFGKHQISPIQPAIGEKFDPNAHQAMFEAPAPGAEPGTVIQVMQHGFRMAEQLLRPAMVGVAKAAPGAPADSGKADAAKTEPSGDAAKSGDGDKAGGDSADEPAASA